MGSTMCKGGSLQYTLQFNQIKLPKPHKIRITYKIIQCYKVIQRCTIDTNQLQEVQERLSNHTLGPSMPQVALTPLGLPSLASNHKNTQGSNK